MLTTATQQVFLNNRTPAPSNGPTLQLYQPGGVFTMSQTGNANVSDAYVVFYTGDVSASVHQLRADVHTCCTTSPAPAWCATSRSTARARRARDLAREEGWRRTFYLLGLSGPGAARCAADAESGRDRRPGPAVNIEGLSDLASCAVRGSAMVARAGRSGGGDGEACPLAVSRRHSNGDFGDAGSWIWGRAALGVGLAACCNAPSRAQVPAINPGVIQNDVDRQRRQLERQSAPPKLTGPAVIGGEREKSQLLKPGGPKFRLRKVEFDASKFITPAELDEIAKKYVGKNVDIAALLQLVADINAIYTERGIVTGIATLPEQDAKGGMVESS